MRANAALSAHGRSVSAGSEQSSRARSSSGRPDTLVIALAILTAISISKAHIAFPWLAPLRPAQSMIAVALLCLILKPAIGAWPNLTQMWQAKIILGIAAFTLVGAPFGLSLGATIQFFMENYSKVLLHGLLLFLVLRTINDLRTLVWSYLAACGLMVYLAVFVFQLEQTSRMSRLGGMEAYDSNDFGCIAIAGFPLALAVFHSANLRGKVFSLSLLFGLGIAFARTGSRGGFVGLVGIGVALLFMLPVVSVVKRVVFAAAVAGALVVAAPQGYWEQMSTLLEIEDDYNWSSVDGRREIAKRGVGYMLTYPVFGIGAGNFSRAEITISDKVKNANPDEGIFMAAAHNSYVQVGAELGLPGLFLWCSLVIGSIISLLRLRRQLPAQWSRGDPDDKFLFYFVYYLPIGLIGFAITATFVSFAYLEPVYTFAAFAAGATYLVRQRLRLQQVPGWSPEAPTQVPGRSGLGSRSLRTLGRGGYRFTDTRTNGRRDPF